MSVVGRAGFRGGTIRVVLATLSLLAATAVFSPAPGRADTNYPVLLVHGGLGKPADFDTMKTWLEKDGYQPFTVDLDPFGIDTVGNAGRIKAKVDEVRKATKAPKVHLIGHSMGGLSARYYIKDMERRKEEHHVATYTAFGTSQHGHPANACRPNEWVPDQCPSGKVMKELNAGDDTPGSVYYTSIASKQAHAEEANGTWHPLDQGACLRMINGGPHGEEPKNKAIYDAVKNGLDSTCPTGWTNLPDGWTNLPDLTL